MKQRLFIFFVYTHTEHHLIKHGRSVSGTRARSADEVDSVSCVDCNKRRPSFSQLLDKSKCVVGRVEQPNLHKNRNFQSWRESPNNGQDCRSVFFPKEIGTKVAGVGDTLGAAQVEVHRVAPVLNQLWQRKNNQNKLNGSFLQLF